jgi:hypothetical protein
MTRSDPIQRPGRPFPWFCPRCRRQEVWQATVPYQCQRLYEGQPIIPYGAKMRSLW